MDTAAIRSDFPILHQEVNGKPLVYLDSAATAQKPKQVLDALNHYYQYDNANVHRAVHAIGERATLAYEGARAKVARFIGSPHARQIIFTRNTTESINLVAYSWTKRLSPDDEILITPMEHHSNLIPWQQMALRHGCQLRFMPLSSDGRIDMAKLPEYITARTKLVALTHVSNVLGVINPVAEITALAHQVGARVLIDGAQSVPHFKVDVAALDCDFYAFSGHKMCAPTGIGVLYGKLDALEELAPFLFGGEMIATVTLTSSTWKELPWRLEAGTPNISGAIGLGAAVDYLESIGMDAVKAHDDALTAYAVEVLSQLSGVTIYGPLTDRTGLVTFNFADIHPHDIATVLDQEGVAVRAGHHCCQPLMQWLDVPATVRASFYLYNTAAEVDILARALERTREFFVSR
jgi:cysteine desulfurase/selenocysteine lyase